MKFAYAFILLAMGSLGYFCLSHVIDRENASGFLLAGPTHSGLALAGAAALYFLRFVCIFVIPPIISAMVAKALVKRILTR